MSTDFDAAYYRRFYGRKPVYDRRRVGRLAEAVIGLCAWWGVPVRSVLDVGAGPGHWRAWLAEHRPAVRYHSVDISPYAARRYGHELADIAEWRPRRPSDLVVCQGVLQYLDDDAAGRAIANLGVATRAVLFVEVPTVADRADVIDPERTDLDVHWRTGDWYRDRLDDAFIELGCGLYYARSGRQPFYELERSRITT